MGSDHPQDLIGLEIIKKFGVKLFNGIVKSYDSIKGIYNIEYEDGDSEELDNRDVKRLRQDYLDRPIIRKIDISGVWNFSRG
jgi:hypothetical protein